MKHVHLFEFMDLKWYPYVLLKIQTKILQVIMTRTAGFDYTVPYINSIIEKTGEHKIIDLCSGASGPWLRIYKNLSADKTEILLTDKYPNIRMFKDIKRLTEGKIDYIEKSIDALNIPKDLTGIRTIFTGFHHFRRREVKHILLDAQKKRQPICIFDYVPSKILTILLFPITFVISILQFYFFSFLARPFSFTQLLFTNIVPIIPLISAWDGFVSGLRKYGKNELVEIVQEIKVENYKWELGEDRNLSRITPLVYLTGNPAGKG